MSGLLSQSGERNGVSIQLDAVFSLLSIAHLASTIGPMATVSILGQQMIIVNSAKTALDMLDKKSAIYSDRPVMPMGGELVGWKDTLVLVPYGDRFRNYRKFFHQVIGSNASVSLFYPIEELETHRFLKSVLKNPDDLVTHIRQ